MYANVCWDSDPYESMSMRPKIHLEREASMGGVPLITFDNNLEDAPRDCSSYTR